MAPSEVAAAAVPRPPRAGFHPRNSSWLVSDSEDDDAPQGAASSDASSSCSAASSDEARAEEPLLGRQQRLFAAVEAAAQRDRNSVQAYLSGYSSDGDVDVLELPRPLLQRRPASAAVPSQASFGARPLPPPALLPAAVERPPLARPHNVAQQALRRARQLLAQRQAVDDWSIDTFEQNLAIVEQAQAALISQRRTWRRMALAREADLDSRQRTLRFLQDDNNRAQTAAQERLSGAMAWLIPPMSAPAVPTGPFWGQAGEAAGRPLLGKLSALAGWHRACTPPLQASREGRPLPGRAGSQANDAGSPGAPPAVWSRQWLQPLLEGLQASEEGHGAGLCSSDALEDRLESVRLWLEGRWLLAQQDACVQARRQREANA